MEEVTDRLLVVSVCSVPLSVIWGCWLHALFLLSCWQGWGQARWPLSQDSPEAFQLPEGSLALWLGLAQSWLLHSFGTYLPYEVRAIPQCRSTVSIEMLLQSQIWCCQVFELWLKGKATAWLGSSFHLAQDRSPLYTSIASGSMDLILGSQRLRTLRALVHMSAAITFISLSLKLGAKFWQ